MKLKHFNQLLLVALATMALRANAQAVASDSVNRNRVKARKPAAQIAPAAYDSSVPKPAFSEVRYGPHERNVLDCWKADSDQPTPWVLVIHGGAWESRSKEYVSEFVDVSKLLKAGVSVVAIDYRYIRNAKAEGVEPPVKAPMEDCARALQFVRSQAKEWNLDKERVGAAGGSAGSCSSLYLAFHDDLANPKSEDPIARESTRLYCAAVRFPQTSLDPKQMKEWTPNSKYGAHAFGLKSFAQFLASRDKIMPWIKEYSPCELVNAGDPPVYLWYRTPPALGQNQKDPTHTANFGVTLQELCASNSVPCELVYPGAPNVKHPEPTDYLIDILRREHSLLLLTNVAAGEVNKGSTTHLGILGRFWRYSAALGPGLEKGGGLRAIPELWQQGDFPYQKRPFDKEFLYADSLSVVRLLGGYRPEEDPEQNRDLVYRDSSGALKYRMELLRARLRPYIENGYTNLTLVLDNIPNCLSEKPIADANYGNAGAPKDPKEWHAFIKELCTALVNIFGVEGANRLRFRVGTEANNLNRFKGTQEQYFQHYEAAATAVKAILPGASIGPYNIMGIDQEEGSTNVFSRKHPGGGNVKTADFAKYCANKQLPFDFLAFSLYPNIETDPFAMSQKLLVIQSDLLRRYPSLAPLPLEIHEFDVTWVKDGSFKSECGAQGAAYRSQLMMCLLQGGINAMWHWGWWTPYESQGWTYSIWEAAAGGDCWLLKPTSNTVCETKYLGLASFKTNRDVFIFTAKNQTLKSHRTETVVFELPETLSSHGTRKIRWTALNRHTAVYDRIRNDLDAAGLLTDPYKNDSERLSTAKWMGKGDAAAALIKRHTEEYDKMYRDSLTLKPFTKNQGSIAAADGILRISLHLTAPEVFVITLE